MTVTLLIPSIDALAAPASAPVKPAPAVTPTKPATPATPAKPSQVAKASWRKVKAKPTGPEVVYSGIQMISGGGSRIFVELSGVTGPIKITESKTTAALSYVLEGVRVDSQNNRNPLELVYHNTPVLRARVRPSKLDTELVLEMRADAKPTVKTVDLTGGNSRIEIDFPAGNYAREAEPLPGENGQSGVRPRQSAVLPTTSPSTTSPVLTGAGTGTKKSTGTKGGMGPTP